MTYVPTSSPPLAHREAHLAIDANLSELFALVGQSGSTPDYAEDIVALESSVSSAAYAIGALSTDMSEANSAIESLDAAFPFLSYCPDRTLAQLALLTTEEALALRLVRVTDGYTLQGDIGPAYSAFDGAKWTILGSNRIPSTANRAEYDMALARNYSAFRSGRVRVTGISGHSVGLPRPLFVNASGSQGPGPGGFSINTSNSSTSYVYRSTYSGAIEVSPNSHALEEVYWEAYAYVEALSISTERYMARAGLEGNMATQYSSVFGATFYYDEGNIGGMGGSPYWQCVTRNNSLTPATTITVTSTFPGIGQGMATGRQRLGIRINSTEVVYTINDVVVATHNTSLPTGSGKRLQPQQAILKTVGTTSRYFGLDHEAVVEIFNTSSATA